MAESKELKKIKKLYGENFMKLCRELFPTLLEQEGLLTKILTSSFSTNSRTLFEDIKQNDLEENFKNFIYSKVDVEKDKIEMLVEKTPYELLEEAGYNLYECNSEEEIQKFKKYYKHSEELCTFRGGRLNRCLVFFAVKKDAEKLIREDFKEPKREDEYGTSVMGIQFTKTEPSKVSIKNRYNHTVNNPDATYGNDLDRIIPGLTQSFANLLDERGLKLNSSNIEKFELPGYTVAGDGKYYKYNLEINGIYYCPGNIIIDDGNVVQLEPEKQVLIDYFVLDKESKRLKLYDVDIEDSFIDDFKNIEKIEMQKGDEKEKRIIKINKKDCKNTIIIEINKNNCIVVYKNEDLADVGNAFLRSNKELRQLELPNLTEIGNVFLDYNEKLSQLELPKLTEVGDEFLYCNEGLIQLELPNLTRVGNRFLHSNKELRQLELPNLAEVGDEFLYWDEGLIQLELPNLTRVGNGFLHSNEELKQLELPNLTRVGNNFLSDNKELKQLELPNLTEVGNNFLFSNEKLSQLELPKLTEVGDEFLYCNEGLIQLELPNLTRVGNGFLHNNEELKQLELPNLTTVGNFFLVSNKELSQLKLPNLRNTGFYFRYPGELTSSIDAKNIAELDKQTRITTSEISWSKNVIEKIKSIFKRKEENQR